jgi:hypothetical protein
MASMDGSCEKAGGFKATIFFVAVYLLALGSGCLKPNMIAHGADQFAGTPDGARRLSTYFNSAYFSFCAGELVALTALVWVQTHSGMDVGFGHDGRAHQPRLRRRVLPEQAPAGQHLHSYCKSKWHNSTITCTVLNFDSDTNTVFSFSTVL